MRTVDFVVFDINVSQGRHSQHGHRSEQSCGTRKLRGSVPGNCHGTLTQVGSEASGGDIADLSSLRVPQHTSIVCTDEAAGV